MGLQDTVTKVYMNRNEVFADAFNYYLHEGEFVIQPDQLHELDTTELIVPYGADGVISPEQIYRDHLKQVVAMEDGKTAYLLLGIENQTEVQYAMPLKVLHYDIAQYVKQVEAAARSHREAKDYRSHNRGEFLSGFYKDDRLLPVVTLVIFFSPDEWDGPRTLREMMQLSDSSLDPLLPEYRLNILAPSEMKEQDFSRFHSSLGNVLGIIKYSRDKNDLRQWTQKRDGDIILGREEVNVLNACVNAKLEVKEEEKMDVRMHNAFDDIREEGAQEREEQVQRSNIEKIMKAMHLTAKEVMDILEIPEEQRGKYLEALRLK